MEISKRTETIIKIICILILIALNIAIYMNGKDLSCDKCQVTIKQNNDVFKINITTLYENYLEGNCVNIKYGI